METKVWAAGFRGIELGYNGKRGGGMVSAIGFLDGGLNPPSGSTGRQKRNKLNISKIKYNKICRNL